MRNLLTAVTCCTLGLDAGVLAFETSGTTRVPLAEIRLGVARPLLGPLHGLVAYRGSWRNAGTDLVGVFSTVHRVQVGVGARTEAHGFQLGAELSVVPTIETYHLRGPGPGASTTRSALGGGLDLFFGLPVSESVNAHLRASAMTRADDLDLAVLAGVDLVL